MFGVQFSDPQTLGYVGLCSAIVGHSFSVFLKFRGGKGVATAIGGLLAVMFWAILAGLAVWVAVFYASRYVSLASLALAAARGGVLYNIPVDGGAFLHIACDSGRNNFQAPEQYRKAYKGHGKQVLTARAASVFPAYEHLQKDI